MLNNKKIPIFFVAGVVTSVIVASFLYLKPNAEPLTRPKSEVASSVQGVAMPKSAPVELRIPSLGINTSFVEPLGLLPDGEIEVPDSYTEVGLYKFGPTPGELGPAVILGHVDSYQGPAVLFSLGQIKVGERIYIKREDGTEAVFEVTELERPQQAAFPTVRVYGDIDHAGLRLITCSGIYIRGTQRYTHNLIVYAKLISV